MLSDYLLRSSVRDVRPVGLHRVVDTSPAATPRHACCRSAAIEQIAALLTGKGVSLGNCRLTRSRSLRQAERVL